MELKGEHHIAASRERVYAALNDPEILRRAVPGCKSLERVSDDSFEAQVALKVGPVKALFKGKVTLGDLDPPNGYSIKGEGQGGVAGFASGGARVTLIEEGDGTLLRYEATAQVGGKLAQVGQRMVAGVSRKLAAQFFTALGEAIAESDDGNAAPEIKETAPPETEGLPLWIWVTGVLALVAALLLYIGV